MKILKITSLILGGLVAVLVCAIFVLFQVSQHSLETARKGIEAVKSAALQGQSGDELVAIGRRFGLNITYDDLSHTQMSLEGMVTYQPSGFSHPSRQGNISIGQGSGILTLWGGFVFDRWFCEMDLERGRLKPNTQPKVFFLD